MEAIVAFTDIKAASKAYNEDQMLNGAVPLSVAFCDALGTAHGEARCPVAQVEKSREETRTCLTKNSSNSDLDHVLQGKALDRTKEG